ncbi:hypothetical protein [Amycolatopsis sp. CA-126428]|uniref:hypothetical protein n=1 Tax=Amycolatopsis sp. CA-126428 TaxID=2073158 RepID=UPI0011B0EFD6|nr:hypothetical protein [Amycolatopsis sp. CA-126428]
MTDAVMIGLVVTCARAVTIMADAFAQRIVLRSRIELARVTVATSVSVEVAGQERDACGVRVPVTDRGLARS